MQKDSAGRTILVAVLLCVACSVLVSSAAIFLRERQEKNKQLDIKKNLLLAAGLLKNTSAGEKEILKAYKAVSSQIINLETGDEASGFSLASFDQRKMARDSKYNKVIDPKKDSAKIKFRSKFSVVYQVKEKGKVSMLMLPVHGKGLWSTLYGFIALDTDTRTVKGIGFYEHGETAGLGGEIDNDLWKRQWIDKLVLDEKHQPIFKVNKGEVNPSDPFAQYKVDGLSGATITSNGVTGLVQYWLGDDGFGPYLAKFRQSQRERS